MVSHEKAIRALVKTSVESYATGFSDRHLQELDDDDGVINMKINNIFIAALGEDIQYYSALMRSLDSSLGNMIEKLAINIAELSYDVHQYVEGYITRSQTDKIAELLEQYKRKALKPSIDDYARIYHLGEDTDVINKRHESDYYLVERDTNMHYLIELKIGGDLDNKKARSEKEALLEQYCILLNKIKDSSKIKLFFATAYNRYGEGNVWRQGRVLQFFAQDELLISGDFWNFICHDDNGFEIVLDEYRKNAFKIVDALRKIKSAYLPNN